METIAYLRAWRLSQGLTQKELIQKVGLTQPQLSRWENLSQTPSLLTLEKLAGALGIEMVELLNPPHTFPQTLSREQADRIARSVVSSKRNLGKLHNQLADAAASLISQKLNAYGVPGRRLFWGKRWRSKFRSVWARRTFPEAILKQVLARVDKVLLWGKTYILKRSSVFLKHWPGPLRSRSIFS